MKSYCGPVLNGPNEGEELDSEFKITRLQAPKDPETAPTPVSGPFPDPTTMEVTNYEHREYWFEGQLFDFWVVQGTSVEEFIWLAENYLIELFIN
jgi:hypothetical protein